MECRPNLRSTQNPRPGKNTIVWFTSDNGPWILKGLRGGSSGLLRDGKGSTWEGGMRVPGLAWWPGKIPANTVNEQMASTLDLYTSMLSLAGVAVPTDQSVDGQNILPLLTNPNASDTTKAFFYYGPRELHAIRKGKWKLHIKTSSQLKLDYFNGHIPLLFNLDEDPGEQYPLEDQHPEIVNELLKMIQDHKQSIIEQSNYWE